MSQKRKEIKQSFKTLLSNCTKSDTKLLKFMSNNILKDAKNIRYHHISVHRLSKKLKDPQVVINVLTHSGFNLHKNKKILIFDVSNMDKLRKLKKAIHDKRKSSNKDIHKIRKSRNLSNLRIRIRKPKIICICNNILTETTPNQAYGNDSHVFCDECMEIIKETETIFHCDKGITTKHQFGFDLCEMCALKQMDGYNDNQVEVDDGNDESDNDQYALCNAMKKINGTHIDNGDNTAESNNFEINTYPNDTNTRNKNSATEMLLKFVVLVCYLELLSSVHWLYLLKNIKKHKIRIDI